MNTYKWLYSKIQTCTIGLELKTEYRNNLTYNQYPLTINWVNITTAKVLSKNDRKIDATNTHTHPFNGPFSGTTRVGRYQKGKTNLDFAAARDSEWQWHQLGHMQVCTSLQTDNHASTSPLSFYGPDALPAAQPTASKHSRHEHWSCLS